MSFRRSDQELDNFPAASGLVQPSDLLGVERWTTGTPASIASAGGRGLRDIIKAPTLSSYTVTIPPLFPPFFSQTRCFFFFSPPSFFYSLCFFHLAHLSPPPLPRPYSSLLLMCCFPAEFGCFTMCADVCQQGNAHMKITSETSSFTSSPHNM